MKKIFTTLILYYLLFAINSSAHSQSSSTDVNGNKNLSVGMVVYLEQKKSKSKSEFHIVEKGETLYSISQLHGVQLAKLRHKNRLDKNQDVQEGEKVFLRKRKPKNYSAA